MPEPTVLLPASLKRILILRLSALGDIVNALYALPALRRAYPSARIGWVVDDRFRDLFDCIPDVDEVIVFPRARWGRALRNPIRWASAAWEVRTYARDLRGRGYEAVIDLQGNAKSAFHLWAGGIPLRIGYDAAGSREGAHRFANVHVSPAPGRVPRAEKFLSLLRGVGVEAAPSMVRFRVPDDDEAAVDRFLASRGLSGRRFAVAHPGSSAFGSYKRWPAERFAELARRLAGDGLGVVVTWGPGEAGLAEAVAGGSEAARRMEEGKEGSVPIVRALETRPIGRLIALLQRAAIFVGNDSGPLHLASACGTPVVGIYGPKDPGVYGPFAGPRATLYHPLPCSPCGRRRCGYNECMELIPLEAVVRRVKALARGGNDPIDAVREGVVSLLRGETGLLFAGTPLRGQGDGRLPVEASPPARGMLRRFHVGRWTWDAIAPIAAPLADAAMRSKEGLPGTPVRQNPRRAFVRAELPDLQPDGGVGATRAFIKVYPIRNAGAAARALVGRSQAEVEFARLLSLHAAGAPVPRPLALGRGPGVLAVALQDLGDAPTVGDRLAAWAASHASERLRTLTATLRSLAVAAARLHGAGFLHGDFHVGNVLQLADGSVRVLDAHRGHERNRVALKDRARSLAQLCFSLSTFVTVGVRVRLIKAYAAYAAMDRASTRALIEAVDGAFSLLRDRYARRQARRASRGGSRVWIGALEGASVRAMPKARVYLNAPETVEAVVKNEAGRRVLRVRKGPLRLAVKEDTRAGRGLREWIGAHQMLARQIPAPPPAFILETRGGVTRLATEWLDGAVPANEYAEARLRSGASPAWRREAAWRLGRWVRRLHAAGVYHADLKAGNLLARDAADDGPEFFALDLDRLRVYPGEAPRGLALENLAQLNAAIPAPVTRVDRLRCFFAYTARDGNLRREWKGAVRDIMRRTVARRHRWP